MLNKKYKKYMIVMSILFILFQMIAPLNHVSANTESQNVKTDDKSNNSKGLEVLTIDKKGNIFYDDEPLMVGKGNDKIPANLSNLMKKGVPQTLNLSRASVGGAKIVYKGQITYGYYTVGDFTVNNKQAFCMEHPKGTPATNQPNNGLSVYDNKSIAAVLYWGWGGTKNIFKDRKLGIVATSLALSHFYYGDTPGTPPSGYDTLITKGKNKDIPKHGLDLNGVNSLVNLSVSFDGKKQKSQTATLRADKANSITYKVPANITLVNETTGATATNKSVKISGGQKFHLEAKPNVAKTVTSAKLKGTIKEFQPLIVKPVTSGLQDIGTWRYFDDPKMVVSFKAVFKARNGDFEITKKGSDGKLLTGAEYDVKNSSNVLVKHVKTGANGKVKLTGLVAGVYTVTETKAPAGYTLDKTPKKVTVKAGQTALMTFTNKQVFVQVKVKKGDTETGDAPQGDSSLQGAKYGVFEDAKATIKLDEVTIGKDLTALSKKLPMNGASRTLYVKETKAPVGYNIDKTIYKVVIKQANTTGEVFVGNATSKDKVIQGGFDLLKTANKPLLQGDAVQKGQKLSLAGAEFTAKLKSSGKVSQKQVTDKNGKAVFSKLAYGTYVVSETKVPDGYLAVPDFEVKITKEGQTFHYDLEDKVKESKIKLVKKDKETQKVIPLSGVTFKIKDSTGRYIEQGGKTDFLTTKDGTVTLADPLPFGKYTLEEVKAPDGYLLNKNPLPFTVTGKEPLITLDFYDVPVKGKVKGQKMKEVVDVDKTTDSQTIYKEVPANGITFDIIANKDIVTYDGTLRAKKGDVVDKVKTDKNGKFESNKSLYIPKGNEYKLVETNTPENYIPIKPVTFSIDYKDQLTEIVYEIVDVRNMMKKGSFDITKTANKPLFMGEEKAMFATSIFNKAVLPLKGAEFTAISNDGKVKQVQVTDTLGKAFFKDLPYGVYNVSETFVPDGYKPVADFKVTITEDGQTFHYDLMDKVIESSIKIIKKDKETGEIIPRSGATFKIIDSKGDYVEQLTNEENPQKVTEYVTSDDGTLMLPQMLPFGKYELEEVQAPDGYLLNAETVPFEVTKETDQQVITLSFFDTPAMGKVKGQKMKEIIDREATTSEKMIYKEVPAEGITFDIIATKDIVTYDGTLRAKKDEVVDTVKTDEDGKFESTKSLYIPKGNEYKLVETNTPENYVPIEPVIFSIDYKDQMTEIVYETFDIQNMMKKGSFDLLKTANKPLFTGMVNPLLREKPLTLEGAEFTVMSKNREIVQIGITDKNGYLAFSDLPYGHYFVSETKTPEGYKPVEDFTIDITEDGQTFHYTLMDEVIESTIKVVKKDLETGEVIPRSGAKFKIKDSLGNYVEQYVSEPILEKITEFETNEDGTLELPEMLAYGKYELEEVQAPDGYLLSAETVPFEVTKETDQQEIELSFFDTPAMGKIKGQKMKEIVDTEKSTAEKVVYKEVPAEDITFDIIATKDIVTYDGTVRAKKDEVVDTVKTDKDGKFESSKSLYIPKGNEYKLVETNTPENYVPIEPVIFSIAYKDQSTEIVYESVDVKNMLKKGDVEISKKALGGTDELAGATLNIKGKDIDLTWVSSDKSPKKFNLPNGNYILTETIANKGYELNKQQVPFEVKDGKVAKVIIYNKKIEKPTVPLIKKMLPTTGDTRLDIIVLVTGLLMIAGVVLYLRKRKTNQQ